MMLLGGCGKLLGPKHDPIPAYADGIPGLTAFATDILKAAQRDDRDRVHDLVASLKMSRAELDWLFGEKEAADLAPAYEQLMATFVNLGAVDLCALVYDRKYDAVEALVEDIDHPPIGPPSFDSPLISDAALRRTMVNHPTIYTLRFLKKGEPKSTRYAFFFFHDGKWRTGNLLGHVIAKRAGDLTTTQTSH